MKVGEVPVENELVTTARIEDNRALFDNINVLELISKAMTDKLEDDCWSSLLSRLEWWKESGVLTKSEGHINLVATLVRNILRNVVLTDEQTSALKMNLGSIYEDLLEFTRGTLSSHTDTIPFSIRLEELKEVLEAVEKQPYSNIIKLNSLLYVNANSLSRLYDIMKSLVEHLHSSLAKVRIIMDMAKYNDSYDHSTIVDKIDIMQDAISMEVHRVYHDRYHRHTDDKLIINYSQLSTTSTNEEIISFIEKNTKNLNGLHSLIRYQALIDLFNALDLGTYNPIAYACVMKIKLSLDTLVELMVKDTDELNNSIDRIKKSIPFEESIED